MSDYTTLAPYLRPEFPKFAGSEGSSGYTWEYRYPNTAGSKPLVGELWADGLPLTSVSETPALDNSAYNELTVSTVYSVTGGGPAATTLEEVRYSIRPSVMQVELAQHPAFLPGGSNDIYGAGTAVGGTAPNIYTETALAWIILWENEPNPVAKARRQVYFRDKNGNAPYDTPITIPSSAGAGASATAYIKLRQLNYSTIDVYLPVWQKISIYRGQAVPVTGSWGQYVPAASVPSLDSSIEADYPYFIKTGDSAERTGNDARWQRTEEWTGYTAVYFDVDTLNPASLTLP